MMRFSRPGTILDRFSSKRVKAPRIRTREQARAGNRSGGGLRMSK